MDWTVSTNLASELGDDGPWVWHLKDAWLACATDSEEGPRHSEPRQGVKDSHAETIAFWAPMLQPMMFGLGWSRPDIGLLRWRDMGYPVLDPVLGAVMRWWGEGGINDFISWSASPQTDALRGRAEAFAYLSGAPLPDCGEISDSRDLQDARQRSGWSDVWGGGSDSMHLGGHCDTPLQDDGDLGRHLGRPARGPVLFEDPGEGLVLLFDTYRGWYRGLLKTAADVAVAAEFPVDVVVKPVGWLGTYRISTTTHLWHRTEEWIHKLGNEPLG